MTTAQNSNTGGTNFDLFRITHAKREVNLCANTLREFNREGLTFYKKGRLTLVSRSELDFFIRSNATKVSGKKEVAV